MTAIAWATYGLILATVGILASALFTAIGRSDELRSDLGARIDHQGSELRARIDNLGSELRIELGGEIRGLRAEFGGLRGEFGGLRGEFNSLRNEVNGRIDVLHEDMRQLRASASG